ncbi:MAG: G8 domain-containing protein, partial [Ignavibacteria bacterium]|nr:G8 domain-containing protein [Ignavibacteria bacterium]
MKRLILFSICSLVLIAHAEVSAATATSVASGNWSNPNIWNPATVPVNGTTVIIAAGTTVTVDVNTADIQDLTINPGAVLQGDGTGKVISWGRGGGEDFSNNGTFNASGANAVTVRLAKNSQWGGTSVINCSFINLNTRVLQFTAGVTVTVNLSGAPDPFLNPGRTTPSTSVTFNYNGTSAQDISSNANILFNSITVSNAAGVTLQKSLTTTNLTGNLTVTGGGVLKTANGSSAFSITGTAGKALTVGANSTLNLGSNATTASSFPTGFSTLTLDESGTVEYSNSSSAAQVISLVPTYGGIRLTGTGAKSIASGTLTLTGSWTNNSTGSLTMTSPNTVLFGPPSSIADVLSGTTATTFNNLTINDTPGLTAGSNITVTGTLTLTSGTFADGGNTITVNGNVASSSTHTGAGKILLTGGAGAHTLSGTGSYTNLEINDANGATLSGNTTLNGTLTLTSGLITTGANKVVINSTGSVVRTSGYVVGNLEKVIPTGATAKTFEIGDATNYTPALVSFGSVTTSGSLLANTTAGDHPSIGSSGIVDTKSVNRYWTLTNSGIAFTTYDATFTFVAGDIDVGASTSNFFVQKYNAPTWTTPTVGTRTATSTQATGLTSFSDFALGEPKVYTITASAGANGTISPSGAVSVNHGSNQSFTITPNTGYHVADVLVDGSSVGAVSSYDFTNVTANHTITASFAIDVFTITASAGANGTITPSGAVSVNYGSNQSFTVTPNTGYHVADVLVDGSSVGAVSSYDFTNVTANHTIAASFAIDTYTITAS